MYFSPVSVVGFEAGKTFVILKTDPYRNILFLISISIPLNIFARLIYS